jgi:hypothetical protein
VDRRSPQVSSPLISIVTSTTSRSTARSSSPTTLSVGRPGLRHRTGNDVDGHLEFTHAQGSDDEVEVVEARSWRRLSPVDEVDVEAGMDEVVEVEEEGGVDAVELGVEVAGSVVDAEVVELDVVVEGSVVEVVKVVVVEVEVVVVDEDVDIDVGPAV